MTDTSEDHEGTVSIGGRTITNLRFADDIDGSAGQEEELANLVERLDKATTAYGMEISAEKTKLMKNNTSGINTEIKVNGKKLETVTSFKYLGSDITDESFTPYTLSRIAQTTTALTRLKPAWNEYFSQFLHTTVALPCYIHPPVCLSIMDPHSRAPKKNTGHGNEVLPQDTTHLIQRPCYQRGSPCQDPTGNWTTRRPPDDRKETQTEVVWSCFPFIRSGQNHLARHSERGKKTGRQRKRWEDNIRE